MDNLFIETLETAKKVNDLERLKVWLNKRYRGSETNVNKYHRIFNALETKYKSLNGWELFNDKKPTGLYVKLLYAYRLSVSGKNIDVFNKIMLQK
jgi:hypothetical protein